MQNTKHIRHAQLMMNELVPMRDGVKLATSVVLPAAPGCYPVVLARTAYNRMGYVGDSFAQRGLAFVAQDCRGRYGSEGVFYPWINETNDGLDTLDWIAAQPWCNGRIGMFGDSYLGGVQFAVAPHDHPNLCALNPRFIMGDGWQHAFYNDGVFSLALVFSWLCLECSSRTSAASVLPNFDVPQLMRHLPLGALDEAAGSGVVRAYRDFVEHETHDEYWAATNWRAELPKASAPMLFTAGWYDYYAGETFLNYQAATHESADPKIAAGHRVLVGPWTHGISGVTQLGQLDFGADALRENDATERWLDCMLNGGRAEDFQRAPIRIFVMGKNVWRDEWEWPLARTDFVSYYLHSNGAANTLWGDGSLNTSPPKNERADRYVYDPDNPVPTLGGNHSVGPYNPGLYEHALPGPYDQQTNERRDDVLVYTSEVLEEDLEVTGPVWLKLFAASDATDTDWVTRLCDVYPDGRSFVITEGVLRARFHKREWQRPELLEPGRVYEYSIDLQATSNVFLKGHRLRLQITSSNFPLWNRNLNTGEPLLTGTTVRHAAQTIHHDAEHSSHLILPVIAASQ